MNRTVLLQLGILVPHEVFCKLSTRGMDEGMQNPELGIEPLIPGFEDDCSTNKL